MFNQVVNAEDKATVADELIENYSGSPYASLGALAAAKSAFESSDRETAQTYLNWILSNSKDEDILHIAKLKLASVLLADGNAADTLALLEVTDKSTFASRYHELIGTPMPNLEK